MFNWFKRLHILCCCCSFSLVFHFSHSGRYMAYIVVHLLQSANARRRLFSFSFSIIVSALSIGHFCTDQGGCGGDGADQGCHHLPPPQPAAPWIGRQEDVTQQPDEENLYGVSSGGEKYCCTAREGSTGRSASSGMIITSVSGGAFHQRRRQHARAKIAYAAACDDPSEECGNGHRNVFCSLPFDVVNTDIHITTSSGSSF